MTHIIQQPTRDDEIGRLLEELGIELEAEFIPASQVNDPDRTNMINWHVSILRSGDVMETAYCQGVGWIPGYRPGWKRTVADAETEQAAIERGTVGLRKLPPPQLRDVIYSLLLDYSVIDCRNFEDFAEEYGYDPDSRKTEAIYQACLKAALEFRGLFDEDEINELREAFADY